MTNQEWRRCKDPVKMILGLKGVASERKGILYLCGGCRSIWDLFFDDRSRIAVEVAERYADGLATPEALSRANYEAECPTFGFEFEPNVWRAWEEFRDAVPEGVWSLVTMGVLSEEQLSEDEPEVDLVVRDRLLAAASLAYAASSPPSFDSDWYHRYILRVDWPGDWLLRCVFGRPFLPAAPFDPEWASPIAVSLAEGIYSEKAFDRMPIFGDALEEAGCVNDDILKHCRQEKPHVRGCWVVDLLLGKS